MLLLSATAVALWPRTYGTEATFVLDGAANVPNPVALAGRIEAALLEREVLASAAMDLPPEQRAPDPIGRLRAGIRVQSRSALGYVVEFRGSDPHSVQRIANRLVDRAVTLVPKVTQAPPDHKAEQELMARTRAVTEFLTAHPEMTLEQPGGKPSAGADSGLEALRSEKRQLEQRLASGVTDNPYADQEQSPEVLSRRLTEIKNTISRREAALKQPRATTPQVSPELTAQWRTLVADLAAAQTRATTPAPAPITGHVTARAPLPSTPLTPNRLVLSLVAALLTMAAAMVAYVLPRKADSPRPRSSPPGPRHERTGAAAGAAEPAPRGGSSEPPPGLGATAPLPRSDPPPPRLGSEPPGPIAVQRTVVLSGGSEPPRVAEVRRTQTDPGGMQAPADTSLAALASTALAPASAAVRPSQAPAAPLFGSRPLPGAGSYSVSSSHPPPMEGGGGARTTVERLSPLQSQHPPAAARRSSPPRHESTAPPPQPIVSRPPALDPEAERWAARFETVPPPAEAPAAEAATVVEEAPRKRAGRWKTQAMGSMVPLEVSSMREERPPLSEQPESSVPYVPAAAPAAAAPAPTPPPTATTLISHDVPSGWRPNVDPQAPGIAALRDAVLAQVSQRRLCLVTTGIAGPRRAQVAAELAMGLAQVGLRVLLVEGDLENPGLHQVLAINMPPGAGFSQQLTAHRADAARPWTAVRCSQSLHVLAEGRMRSPGLSTSGELERALAELREQHHVLVIHAPSLQHTAELKHLRSITQGVVLVDATQARLELGDAGLRQLG
ncbi:MAG TPA: hypothetical protein VHB79_11905 [Polyangiaceae bacterium]|nr:hypothetical protein [Polyangiaceae bacterium]